MTFSFVEGNVPFRSVGLEHDDRTHWKHRRRDERAKFRTSRFDASDDDVNIIPRFERWQLEFSAKGLQNYAKQLDHFGFELGMIGE